MSILTTHADSTIREDLVKKPKFSKETYWKTKRVQKNRKKKRK